MGRMEGKRAIVTGAGSGIARAIAEFGGLDVVFANAGISGSPSATHPFRRPRP